MRTPTVALTDKLHLENALLIMTIFYIYGNKEIMWIIFILISKTRCNLIYYYINYSYVLQIIDTWMSIFLLIKIRLDFIQINDSEVPKPVRCTIVRCTWPKHVRCTIVRYTWQQSVRCTIVRFTRQQTIRYTIVRCTSQQTVRHSWKLSLITGLCDKWVPSACSCPPVPTHCKPCMAATHERIHKLFLGNMTPL